VADVAGVWDFQGFCFCGGNEVEGVATDVYVAQSLRDLGHVAADSLVAGAAGFVVGVLLDCEGAGAVWGLGAVAIEAERGRGFSQQGVVVGAVEEAQEQACENGEDAPPLGAEEEVFRAG
jgi:hypothetical protein